MSKLLCSVAAYGFMAYGALEPADTDVEIKANVVSTSCRISVDNNGLVSLGTKGIDYFANGVTAEDPYQGGSTFYVHVKSVCRSAAKPLKAHRLFFRRCLAASPQARRKFSPMMTPLVRKKRQGGDFLS